MDKSKPSRSVSINPAGTHMAWAANDGKETQITVFEIASRKIVRNFKVESGFKVREVDWANDDTLLFAISATLTSTRRRWPSRLEYLQWLAADVSTGKSRLLMTEGNKRVLGGSQVVRRRIAGATVPAGDGERGFRRPEAGHRDRHAPRRQAQGFRLSSTTPSRWTSTPASPNYSKAGRHSRCSGWPMRRASPWCAPSGTRSCSATACWSRTVAGWRRLLELKERRRLLSRRTG